MSAYDFCFYNFVGFPVLLVISGIIQMLCKETKNYDELLRMYTEEETATNNLKKELSSLKSRYEMLSSKKKQQEAILRKIDNF